MNNHKLLYYYTDYSRGPLVQRLGGQARDSRDKSECDSAVCSSLHGTHRVAIWSFPIFKHEQSSYFCRGPDDFSWALPPWAPPW